MSQLNLMALRHSAFYTPYLMTMAGGYLKNAGFEVNYTLQTPDNLARERLLDGSCDVSQSAVAAGFASLENNQPDNIRHFAQINSRDGFFIASRHTITNFSWQDLIGKSLLADHFFQPLAMLKFALHKNNIEWSSINVIDAGDVNQIDQSFRNGTGDFVHQQGPAPQQLEADGIASVVASVGDAIGPIAFSSLCATNEWLQSDISTVFFDIYKTSLLQCQQSKASDIAQQLQQYGFFNDIQFQVLSNTIATYQTLGCWNHNGSIAQIEYQTLLDVFEFSRFISKRHPFEALVSSI